MVNPSMPHQINSAMLSTVRFTPPLPFLGFTFSQDELDMVLYGYAKNSGSTGQLQIPGHALSGLKIGDLSHGKFFLFQEDIENSHL